MYLDFARSLFQNHAALYHMDLHSVVTHPTIFRMIGYPAIIGFFQWLIPAGWPYAICGFQIALSVYATCVLCRTCIKLGFSYPWALFATAAFAWTYPLLYDQVILTDSLVASLFVLFLCKAHFLLFGSPTQPFGSALKTGLLLAGCFFIRDTTQIQAVVMAPLFVCSILMGPKLCRIKSLAGLLLPLILSFLLYGTWNLARTGNFFITTGAQSSFLYPVLLLAPSHPEVLAGDDPVSVTARENFRKFEFMEIWKVNAALFTKYRLSPLDIARLNQRGFSRLWKEHPVLMLKHAVHELQWEILVSPFRTLETIRELDESTDPHSNWPSVRRLLERSPSSWRMHELATILLVNLSRGLGLCIFLFFLLGVPIQSLRRTPGNDSSFVERGVLLSYWLFFLLYVGSFSVVHVELRYLYPVFPVSTCIGVCLLRRYLNLRNAGMKMGRT